MFPTKPTFCALVMKQLMGEGPQGRRMKEEPIAKRYVFVENIFDF